MKVKLLHISFEVTMNCNLKCCFCYNHHKNTGVVPKPSSYDIARKTLLKIFKVFDVGQLTFTGGEPFMGERFSELVLTARLKGVSVSVISNGNFASVDKYLQLVSLGVKLFELPVHSFNPDIHDTMTHCKGSHQKSVSIIKSLVDNGIIPVAVVVLTKFNCDNIAKTLEYISSLGVDKIMLNRYNIGGEGVDNPLKILPTEQQLKKAFAEVSDIASKLSLTILSSVCTPVCILDPKDYPNIKFSSCSTDVNQRPITIDYLGNLRFCNHSPIVLGNIFEKSAQDILNSPQLLKWENTIPEYCSSCHKYAYCKGGCRAASEQCGLDVDNPDPIISVYNK